MLKTFSRLVESNLASVSTEAAITALGQHDQLFHRQVRRIISTTMINDHNFMALMIVMLMAIYFCHLHRQMAKLFKFPGASAPAPASSTAATAAAAVPDAKAVAAGQPGANN